MKAKPKNKKEKTKIYLQCHCMQIAQRLMCDHHELDHENGIVDYDVCVLYVNGYHVGAVQLPMKDQ